MKVKRCADCANSPKNGFAEDVAIAVLGADRSGLNSRLAQDAVLDIVGAARIAGRDEIIAGLSPAHSVEVDTVVTHGRAGAVSGTIGRAAKQARFSMVLRFATAKADAVRLVELYSPTPHVFYRAP